MFFPTSLFALLLSAASPAVVAHSEASSNSGYVEVWSRRADLPKSLSDMTANTVGDKIYIFGGCDGDQIGYICTSINSKVIIYDPISNHFADSSAIVLNSPHERYRHAAAVVGVKVYLIGGRDLQDGLVEVVDVFDTEENSWSLSFRWTAARSDLDSFVSSAGLVHSVGGYNAAYEATASTDMLDPGEGDSAGWALASAGRTIADMTVERGDFAIVEDGKGLVYAFGGWSDSNNFCSSLRTAEVYDPGDNTWTSLGSMVLGRGDKASGILNGRVFAIGGETKQSCDGDVAIVADVEAFDVATGEWSVVDQIPSGTFRFCSASWSDTIFIFGGQFSSRFCPLANSSCNPLSNDTWSFQELVEHDHGDDDDDDGMSAGAIAGIVLGFVVFVLAAGAVFSWYLSKTRAEAYTKEGNAEGDFESAVELGI